MTKKEFRELTGEEPEDVFGNGFEEVGIGDDGTEPEQVDPLCNYCDLLPFSFAIPFVKKLNFDEGEE